MWGVKSCPWGKGERAWPRGQRWLCRPYPACIQVQSSPAWHQGTGVFEPHQEDTIHSRRSTQPHPQRSHCPGTIGTNKTMNKLTPKKPPSNFFAHLPTAQSDGASWNLELKKHLPPLIWPSHWLQKTQVVLSSRNPALPYVYSHQEKKRKQKQKPALT